MKVVDLIQYISANVPFIYFPNRFPAKSSENACAVVKLSGGAGADRYTIGVRSPSFQVLVRANHPSVAEAKANEIFTFLHGKTFINVGTTFVASCFAEQSEPTYIGDDENGRATYSLNFSCVTKD